MEKEEKMDKKLKKEKDKKEKNSSSREIELLNQQIIDLKNKCMYAQAELINYRKRADDRMADLLKYKNEDLLFDLTDMIDNLKRAANVKVEFEESKKIQIGINMVVNQFMDILKKYDVTEINAIGEAFDPNYMEAMMVSNDITKPDEIVTDVLVPGYKYKDRVLKVAKVKVNKNENKENEEKKGND